MDSEQQTPLEASILVVDDTHANLHFLTKVLTERGYGVRPVSEASLALSSAKTNPPDLILLDIVMPDMSGYGICKELKADERTRDVPIIFISALHEVFDKVKAFSLGGVDYITKPFQPEEVLARIETQLELRNLQKRLEEKNAQLQEALDNVKTLKGLLPICANCKKIRDDKGYWNQIEEYIENHSDALFSHGLCPECEEKLYGDQDWYKKSHGKK